MKFGCIVLATTLAGGSAARRLRNTRRLREDTFIFDTVADGTAQATTANTSDKVGTSCSTDDRRVKFMDDDDQDYMDITTTKWHSGGYRMDCVDKGSHTGWQCWATCSPFPNPNFMEWNFLTFEAKVSGTFDSICKPTIGLKKRWPSYSSNVLALEGEYVDGGSLSETEWTRVVIPIGDLSTAEWPNVDGVKDIYFRNCGTAYSVNPHYQIRGLLLTDDPPTISAGEVTAEPTSQPTGHPTTANPTKSPSSPPTVSPTEPYWPIWKEAGDSNTLEDPSHTCFEQKERLGIAVEDNVFQDYFTIRPDPWVSGGIKFGCQRKDANWVCDRSCFPFDGSTPDWSEKLYLTFLAKVEGASPGCTPKISLTGGGWPRLSSNKIFLEDTYVDAGSLVSSEFRRVAIPLDDMRTNEWTLKNLYALYFHTCGFNEEGSAYPLLTYHVSDLAVTNNAIDVISMPPTTSPTPYVTDDTLLATHRFIHKNWYPIFAPNREPAENSWLIAENDAWPIVDSSAPSHSVTVFIPFDQNVIFSAAADSTIYDKIIVEGSLTIRPVDADVKITVGTIIVEKGGTLNILTEENSEHTVTVEINGALDDQTDPEEMMVGILALEGSLTISGNEVHTKMAPLSQTANAGSNVLVINEAAEFAVGGELTLPDTQEGLNVGHWNFPACCSYTDQTETCTITAIDGNQIICEQALMYDHAILSNAAYISRSVIIRTSEASIDRGHILHTGAGKFEVRNARVENLGRTSTDLIDSTVMAPDGDLNLPPGQAKMIVSHQGSNQIARYAVHAHHSLVEAYFSGNAVLPVGRDGMVAHNSRVHIIDNIVAGANGTGIFLEDGTETGPVLNNYIIGRGGGSRGGDDGRFSSQSGTDMAHGGFGIWCRGKLALVQGNHAEGHFGVSPFAFFVHPNFISDKVIPDVQGTPAELAGKKLKDIEPTHTNGLQLQSYGGFVNNSAVATFQVGIDLSYFSVSADDEVGSIIQDAFIKNLALNGRGISTTHSRLFTLNDVTIQGTVAENTITGIWCNNCNGCTLQTPNTTLVIENVVSNRGGNC